jgi:hypothetical protein
MISRVAAPDTYDRHRASVALQPGGTLQLGIGAQITVLGPAITNQLDLRARGHGWHRFFVQYARTYLVNVGSMGLGPYRVSHLRMVIQALIGFDQLLRR